jgi:hypothetical protein
MRGAIPRGTFGQNLCCWSWGRSTLIPAQRGLDDIDTWHVSRAEVRSLLGPRCTGTGRPNKVSTARWNLKEADGVIVEVTNRNRISGRRIRAQQWMGLPIGIHERR